LALAGGLALLVVGLLVVLSGSPVTVIGTNAVADHHEVEVVEGGYHACQASGTLPAGTTAIRLSATANTGPRIKLKVFAGGKLVTSGEREAGWGVDETVTVPVRRVPRTVDDAQICIKFGPVIEGIALNGTLLKTTNGAGETTSVPLLRFEYLRARHASWFSLLTTVARHLGLGHEPSGTWVVLVLLGLMVAIAVLATQLVLRELP